LTYTHKIKAGLRIVYAIHELNESAKEKCLNTKIESRDLHEKTILHLNMNKCSIVLTKRPVKIFNQPY